MASYFKKAIQNIALLCRGGVDSAYEFVGENVWGDQSLYLNLGFWEKQGMSYDQAAENLAVKLGKMADLKHAETMLDVGFGFADQDILWGTQYPHLRIEGVNITPIHVKRAKERMKRAGLDGRVDLKVGSATNLPFEAMRFDRVVSLEAAFHFDSRQDFFREAFRTLKPGGRLAVADLVLDEESVGGGFIRRLKTSFLLWMFSTPRVNAYSVNTYVSHLEQAGFENVRVESIRQNVFTPFFEFVKRRNADKEFTSRLDPMVRFFFTMMSQPSSRLMGSFDYILLSADKPAERG